ncbi:hypothetical protein [Sphingomonas cavernae]|uniref:Uncharacterized protein n=1 Tax=Sphingomonas cavernae TaxID=2320861 RepID=A0A418WQD2_9SPHN|nr:hypothetical protein [Sphingomonas cavernae]RJF93369.1 hypothetical protein D3876_03235 [Sphingomonas cavernae]
MRIALVTLAAALALAGCGRSEPEEQPLDNVVVESEAPVNDIAPVNIVAPPPEVANATPPAAPPPEFTDDEQMLDDADATGLTARLPAQDDVVPGSTENETRPAE